MKKCVLSLALLIIMPVLAFAQLPSQPEPNPVPVTHLPSVSSDPTNLYAVGVAYNQGATPAVAGNALYARLVNSGQYATYAFTDIDILPNTIKPFTVTTNIGVGVAQKIVTIANIPVFVPTGAGISLNGANTGWAYNFGAMASFKLPKSLYLLPNVRVNKSSVSNGTGLQPIIGIDIGWGQ